MPLPSTPKRLGTYLPRRGPAPSRSKLDTLREAGRRRGLAGVIAWFAAAALGWSCPIPDTPGWTRRRHRPPPGVVVAVWSGDERIAV